MACSLTLSHDRFASCRLIPSVQASRYSKRESSTRYKSLTGDVEADGLTEPLGHCLDIIWKTKGPVKNDELNALYESFLACVSAVRNSFLELVQKF